MTPTLSASTLNLPDTWASGAGVLPWVPAVHGRPADPLVLLMLADAFWDSARRLVAQVRPLAACREAA